LTLTQKNSRWKEALKPLLRKILNFKIGQHFVLFGGLDILIIVTVFVWAQATAAASETTDPNAKNNKIRITADKLFAEVDAGTIEFVGNVKATHAETVITADRLKIFYDPGANKSQTSVLKTESIEKITASGHVKIIYEDIIAETDKAEYTMKSEVLVLTGQQSKITQGGHSITGTKFTLHRSDGKLTAESSEKNRVKAVIQPPEKDK
jgi:lipopolysaccharide export system protein LptA